MDKKSGVAIKVPVFVLHVRKGYEDRGARMEEMLDKLHIPFDYILKGDKEDLDSGILDRYFAGELHAISNATSCALKHLLAYQRILDEKLPGALILEDDIELSKHFPQFLDKCLNECRERQIDDFFLSFEDTSLQFVPGSQRKKGQHVYKAKRDRYAGCYYITSGCARQILQYVEMHKCHLPIDRFHTHMIEKDGLLYLWSHPTFATQGSKNGRFRSAISTRDFNRKTYLALTTPLKKAYKKLLYRLK